MQLTRIKDVASRYSMSPSTFYRWHCYGKFPQLFASIGKSLFVNEAELKKLAKEDSVKNLVRNMIQEYKGRGKRRTTNEE